MIRATEPLRRNTYADRGTLLGKDEVPSSNLGSSSRKDARECVFSFCISIRLPQVLNLRELQSVKEHVQQGADKRAAGELEG